MTSVHPGSPIGSSTQTQAVLRTEHGLVPGLATPAYACIDIAGTAVDPAVRGRRLDQGHHPVDIHAGDAVGDGARADHPVQLRKCQLE